MNTSLPTRDRRDFTMAVEIDMIDPASMRIVVKSVCFSLPNSLNMLEVVKEIDSARSEEKRSKACKERGTRE